MRSRSFQIHLFRFVCCSFHMNVQKYIFFIGYRCNDLVTYFVHSAMRNVILHVDKCLVIVVPSICIFLFDFISLLTYIWSNDRCVVGRLDHTRRTYRCWEIVIPSLFPYIGSEVRIWIHGMHCNKYQDSICAKCCCFCIKLELNSCHNYNPLRFRSCLAKLLASS